MRFGIARLLSTAALFAPEGDPPSAPPVAPPAAPPASPPGPDAIAQAWGQLDPAERQLVETKGWKGPRDGVRSYAELEKTIGQNRLALPGKDAKPEEWEPVYKALGRPDKPDAYDLGDFKPPEGLPWSDARQKAIMGAFHKAGLNSSQAKQVVSDYAAAAKAEWDAESKTIADAAKAAQGALRAKWGGAYDSKLARANGVLKMAAGDQAEALAQVRIEGGGMLLDHPAVAELLDFVAEHWGEDDLAARLGGDAKGGFGAMTPEQAKADRVALDGDPAFRAKLLDRSHPEHKAAVERWNRLLKIEGGVSAVTDEQLRVECLKLAAQRSGPADVRPPLAIADEFYRWCKREAPAAPEEPHGE